MKKKLNIEWVNIIGVGGGRDVKIVIFLFGQDPTITLEHQGESKVE